MKKNLSLAIILFLWANIFLPMFAAAQTNTDFEIVPQAQDAAQVQDDVNYVWGQWWSVRDRYNDRAQDMEWKVGDQLASGIMTRDTLLDYVVYLVKFLSQLGLLIGWLMVVYAGYLYATTIFWWWDASKWKKAITNAIVGILVIAFSYAIMKLLTSALIS